MNHDEIFTNLLAAVILHSFNTVENDPEKDAVTAAKAFKAGIEEFHKPEGKQDGQSGAV